MLARLLRCLPALLHTTSGSSTACCQLYCRNKTVPESVSGASVAARHASSARARTLSVQKVFSPWLLDISNPYSAASRHTRLEVGPSTTHNLDSKVALPSQASPPSSLVQLLTEPGSMHRYRNQPSLGSKSPIPLILSSHPFQTVTLGSASLVTTNEDFPPSVTVSGLSSFGV